MSARCLDATKLVETDYCALTLKTTLILELLVFQPGNDESEESEESHDEDEEEELRTYSPPRNNNEVDQEFEGNEAEEPSTPDQSALWPQVRPSN